ncbi:MAG TPA: hypothetical protein VME68_15400 [Acidobacteriaceae bacterium]|nr:hypothetical protein [Acidobacteriaceae bacterium]
MRKPAFIRRPAFDRLPVKLRPAKEIRQRATHAAAVRLCRDFLSLLDHQRLGEMPGSRLRKRPQDLPHYLVEVWL